MEFMAYTCFGKMFRRLYGMTWEGTVAAKAPGNVLPYSLTQTHLRPSLALI